MKIKFNEETARAARLAFVTTHRAVNLTLEPHKWDDWIAAVQVFEDGANAQVELHRYASGDQQRANAQHEAAPINPAPTFEMGKWYRTDGGGYAQVVERHTQIADGKVTGHLLVQFKVGQLKASLDGRMRSVMGQAYHLKPGAVDQETMAFEHEVDKLRETLKSTEQCRATAEHDRGVWQRKAELAQASIKTQHAEIGDLTEKLKVVAGIDGHALRDMTAMRDYWKNRAEGAEAGLAKMNATYRGLMEKLAEKVQTILRAEPNSEGVRGGQRAADQIAQHVGLIIQPKVVSPVTATWELPTEKKHEG
jgi:hypothetical protein